MRCSTTCGNLTEPLGHIDYFGKLNELSDAMTNVGNDQGAKNVLESSVSTMKRRGVCRR